MCVVLENEHTRSLGVTWVVFHHLRACQSRHDISNEDTVSCKLVVSMIRYLDLTTDCQSLDQFQRLTHENRLARPAPWGNASLPENASNEPLRVSRRAKRRG